MRDVYQAYINKDIELKSSGNGVLAKLTFSVKDVFAIKNYLNTAGNPDWYRTHQPPKEHAHVIKQLLAEGATLKGTTQTDEIMYSLSGENHHYGTPINPNAPKCIPGGSSSGSAVSVAGKSVDFSLGTDTGGSVRIPASYCGLFGIRPTHKAVSLEGVIPLAENFDTVGWMARDPLILQKVGDVVLPTVDGINYARPFNKIILGVEPWLMLDSDVSQSFAEGLAILSQAISTVIEEEISSDRLAMWAAIFKTLQGKEIWQAHGEWIEKEKPVFGPGIKERFDLASKVTQKSFDQALEEQLQIQKQMNTLLGEDALLVIPTAPGPAPLRGLPNEKLNDYRKKVMELTCIAGLAGLPQITIPIGEVEGHPIGLSLISNRGHDRRLLQFVAQHFKLMTAGNLEVKR